MISQKELKNRLHYDKDNGVFTWIKPVRYGLIGKRAGMIRHTGYRSIVIRRQPYSAHRLAFLWMIGEFPDSDIDHINHIKDDNSYKNLRVVSRIENCRNASLSTNNTSGVNGVSFHKVSQKWMAYINVDNKRNHLGLFEDYFDAVSRRMSANNEYNFHENHGRP